MICGADDRPVAAPEPCVMAYVAITFICGEVLPLLRRCNLLPFETAEPTSCPVELGREWKSRKSNSGGSLEKNTSRFA